MFRDKHVYRSVRAMVAFVSILFCVLSLIVPNAAYAAQREAAVASSSDTMLNISFVEDTSTVLANPERGWYIECMTNDVSDESEFRAKGITNILLQADLGAFKTAPISDAKLQEIRSAFNTARSYGLNVIFRAGYDFDGAGSPEPKSLSIISGHIAQLKPIFYEFEDILYCVQAGFLGPWGEWHTSYYGNGDVPSLEARTTVLNALMDAVPKSRQIQIRQPNFIRDMFPNQTMTPSIAFSQSNFARAGFHNDALLSNEDDDGTYVDSAYTRQAELDWAENHDKYAPFVAESNMLTSYSDPANAVYELKKLHAQILNSEYYPGVLSKWKNTTYEGTNTYNYISAHLGYRFVLSSASVNANLAQGGELHLTLQHANTGFANLINARDFQIVLSNGTQTYTAVVNDDARFWTKDRGVMTKDLYFSIPSNIAPGSWNINVNMPNKLNSNPLYSIRFANTNTWDAAKGYNFICTTSISAAASTTTGTEFKQIPKGDAVTRDTPVVPVDVPTPVNAEALSYNRIKISWGAVEGTTKYELYRAASGTGIYTRIATTSSTSYNNTSLGTGTTYYYKVRAYHLAGTTKVYGAFSDVATAQTMLCAPGSIQAAPTSYNTIKLSWGTVAGRTRYELWRSVSPSGPFSRLVTTSSNRYTNTRVDTGTKYYYQVRAYRLVGRTKVYSPYSDTASAQTALLTPGSMKASVVSYNAIRLTWRSVAGRTKYEIWYATSQEGPFSLLDTTGYTSYTNTGVMTGTPYYYKVRAYRLVAGQAVYGGETTTVSAQTSLKAPTSARAKRVDAAGIKVSFRAAAGATGYEIWRSTSVSGTYDLIASTNSLYCVDGGLVTGQYYYYKIGAYRTMGETTVNSAFTAVVRARP